MAELSADIKNAKKEARMKQTEGEIRKKGMWKERGGPKERQEARKKKKIKRLI